MTIDEFITSSKAGKVLIEGSALAGEGIVEGMIPMKPTADNITAEAFRNGLLDFETTTWDEGIEIVTEKMKDKF